jgi:hypothetical protein
MGEKKNVYVGLVRKPEGKDNLGGVGADGRKILEWMFEQRWEGMDWIFLAQHVDRMLNLQMPLRLLDGIS